MQMWCLGGFLPAKGVLVAAPLWAGLGECADGTANASAAAGKRLVAPPSQELFPSLLFVEVWNTLQRLFAVTNLK